MLIVHSATTEVNESTGFVKANVVVENNDEKPLDFIFNQSLPALNINQGVGMYSVTCDANDAFVVEGIGDYICAISSFGKPLAGAYRFRMGGSGAAKAKRSTNTALFKKENAIRPYVAHSIRIPAMSKCEIQLMIDVRA